MKNKVTIEFANERDAAQFIGAIEHEKEHGHSNLFRSIAGAAVQRSKKIKGQLNSEEAKRIRLCYHESVGATA